jgi:chromosomal replication initiation ATPase DnaA
MSVIESPVRESPAAIRRRLFNPAGGHLSSELDITAPQAARRLRAEAAAKAANDFLVIRHEQALVAAHEAAQRIREETRKAAGAKLQASANPPKIGQVIAEICDRYHLSEAELLSKSRKAHVVLPRQISMYLCRTIGLKSLPEIGRRHGGRDHTTAFWAVSKITNLVESYPHLAAEIDDIKKTLGAA